ncbi:MAG: helix-turn-helix transcriptional regulator [Anaerolineae bacterium]|nr:helix-turn-helix transcriptional regulator [Anaerolineae bacterium]
MPDTDERKLRRKMIGVKVRHARTKAGLNIDEVAQAIGLTSDALSAIELGQHDPTLPQLEVMAFLFNIPLTYFWTDEPIEKIDWDFPTLEAIALRQRIIGALLRQARTEAGYSLEDLAEHLDIPVGEVASYELGKIGIPIQQLESLAAFLRVPLEHFIDEGIGPNKNLQQRVTLEEISQFSQLPAEVREFLLNPANLLYVNIAMRLSDMSAETLRGLAEGLLEVTY